MPDNNSIEIVDSFKEAAPILRRPFTPEAVRFKVQAGTDNALIVAYIDARLVIERLNTVCPHLWSDKYEPAGKGMVCHLTVDGITRSDFGDNYVGKGLYSDALKRAAVKFGIGVSLYSVPATWLKAPHVRVKEFGGKKSAEITDAGMTFLRSRYATWLKDVGIDAFGQPLDHGDTEESVGDIEGRVTPADVAAEGEPTDDQRAEVIDLTKKLGLEGAERDLLFGGFGIQQGVASTAKQVDELLAELRSRVELLDTVAKS